MIVDASALLAFVLSEPDARRFGEAMLTAPVRRMPAPTWVEASLRIDRAADEVARRCFDEIVAELGIEIVPFAAEHAIEARRARRLFGKPHHPAGLNFGDCLVYGVARHERMPLLFKGGDFARTDIEPALKD